MGLDDDLETIAAAAAPLGAVTGVLAAEPASGLRLYLVSLGDGEAREWVVLDGAGKPLDRREDVRDAASIVALCELAADVSGGGELESLRAHVMRLRLIENPPGLDDVDAAALELERAVGVPPRVATPAYLDLVGVATRKLERALGETASPFAAALRAGNAAVDEFVRDVERRYKLALR